MTSTIGALVAANLLKPQNAGPLLNILNNVQKHIDAGDYAGAADILELSFIPKVQASMPNRLPAAVGQSLIVAAQGLIDQLRALV